MLIISAAQALLHIQLALLIDFGDGTALCRAPLHSRIYLPSQSTSESPGSAGTHKHLQFLELWDVLSMLPCRVQGSRCSQHVDPGALHGTSEGLRAIPTVSQIDDQ